VRCDWVVEVPKHWLAKVKIDGSQFICLHDAFSYYTTTTTTTVLWLSGFCLGLTR